MVQSESLQLIGASWINTIFNPDYMNYFQIRMAGSDEATVCEESYQVTQDDDDDYVCPDDPNSTTPGAVISMTCMMTAVVMSLL